MAEFRPPSKRPETPGLSQIHACPHVGLHRFGCCWPMDSTEEQFCEDCRGQVGLVGCGWSASNDPEKHNGKHVHTILKRGMTSPPVIIRNLKKGTPETLTVEINLIAGTSLVLYHPPQTLSIYVDFRRSPASCTTGTFLRDSMKTP